MRIVQKDVPWWRRERRGPREHDPNRVATAVRGDPGAGRLTASRPSFAQISPGELSRSHRSLEGPLNCRSCHAGKAEEMDRNCLSCHQDIQRLREEKRGFHARNGDAPCANCHPDHAGHDFELIAWDGGSFETFDHAKTGWSLAGKHAKAACRDCHQPKHQSVEFMKLSKRENPAESWVGLETACASCHEDTHRGALGADCARCHGNEAWKPATAFDHAATAFALTGKHADVECAKCHAAAGLSLAHDDEGRPIPLYKPLPHAECSRLPPRSAREPVGRGVRLLPQDVGVPRSRVGLLQPRSHPLRAARRSRFGGVREMPRPGQGGRKAAGSRSMRHLSPRCPRRSGGARRSGARLRGVPR